VMVLKTKAHFSESLEDYLEAIFMLGGSNVRSIDIANRLNVSRASVNKAVNTLIDNLMVHKQPYGNISLTEYGLEISKRVENKHQILRKFLIDVLGVEETVANNEACAIEHNISDDTASKIEAMINNTKRS